MTKLFIKQCTISRAWYSDKIGQQVPFIREDSEYYWSFLKNDFASPHL